VRGFPLFIDMYEVCTETRMANIVLAENWSLLHAMHLPQDDDFVP
jgi:hypothetical protein